MNKKIVAVLLVAACFASSMACGQAAPEGYQLEQVLLMSRHNLA